MSSALLCALFLSSCAILSRCLTSNNALECGFFFVAKERRQRDEEHTGHRADYQLISLLESLRICRQASKNRKMAQMLSSDSAARLFFLDRVYKMRQKPISLKHKHKQKMAKKNNDMVVNTKLIKTAKSLTFINQQKRRTRV